MGRPDKDDEDRREVQAILQSRAKSEISCGRGREGCSVGSTKAVNLVKIETPA